MGRLAGPIGKSLPRSRSFRSALADLADVEVRRAMWPNLARLATQYTLEFAAQEIVSAAQLALDRGDE